MPRLRRILLFLLLGAVVNVLVAWGCSMWSELLDTKYQSPEFGVEIPASVLVLDKAAAADLFVPLGTSVLTQTTRSGTASIGFTRDTFSYSRGHSTQWRLHHRCDFGLPWRALRYEQSVVSVGGIETYTVPRVPGVRGGLKVKNRDMFVRDLERVLPLVPLPLGFTINTLFYAALLYLPFATFTTLRRRRRIRRNLCLSCGYSLAGAVPTNNTITCPECGKPSACDGASP